jgi:hypothetical protein
MFRRYLPAKSDPKFLDQATSAAPVASSTIADMARSPARHAATMKEIALEPVDGIAKQRMTSTIAIENSARESSPRKEAASTRV